MYPVSAHNCSPIHNIFSCYESIVLKEDIIISDDDDNDSEADKRIVNSNR